MATSWHERHPHQPSSSRSRPRLRRHRQPCPRWNRCAAWCFRIRLAVTFLTGCPDHVERVRRALRFSNRNSEIDRDLTQHTGMGRIGNDPLDRVPGALGAEQLVRDGVRSIGRLEATLMPATTARPERRPEPDQANPEQCD